MMFFFIDLSMLILYFGLTFRTCFYADHGDSCWRSLVTESCAVRAFVDDLMMTYIK